MVTGINSTLSANLYKVSENVNTRCPAQTKSQPFAFEDYKVIQFESKEDFLKCCAFDKVNSLETYTSHRMVLTDSTGLQKSDYEAEYKDYMKSRGCNSEQELKILNTTNMPSKELLLSRIATYFEQDSMFFHYKGITNSELVGAPVEELMSKANLQDVADFYNSRSSGCSFKGSVSCFKTFIDKIAAKDDLDLGDELKEALSNMSQSISNSSDLIDEVSKALEKEKEDMAKENEAERNMKKYNASKIANYQT